MKFPEFVPYNYLIIFYLGSGSYGDVYCAIDMRTSFKVALKFIKIPQTDYGIPKNIIRECGLLKILDHSNVMKVIEIIMQRQ